MTTKNKVIIGAVALIGLIVFYGYQKAMSLKAIFEKIDIKIAGIRNLKISIKEISFACDVVMVNPTNEDFNVNGYIATLKRFNFFYNNKYMATTKVSLSEIEIPRQNELVVKDIMVVIPVRLLLSNLSDLLEFSQNNVTTEAVIEVAGREIYIKE